LVKASLPNPKITLHYCSLALRSLSATSQSKNSRLFHALLLSKRLTKASQISERL
jgi:hypothetical protein